MKVLRIQRAGVRARQAAAVALAGALAVAALAATPAAGQKGPSLKIIGFASKLGEGRRSPQPEARSGGTIEKCVSKSALSAIFTIGNVGSGARYYQHWSMKGKRVYRSKTGVLEANVTRPTRVSMGFSKAGLKNGTYVFQLSLNGKRHKLGSVTRSC